ncbi:F-box domain, Leucine-rich repeat domain, L domain-like protein [Artemisia annua]|uniref:F-box domain, Leucine-rich repeat domain, L domain-like protein n=1 Tax=Artemisia annua TaxID=35608 RepID=A0A2U1NL24_ARTAN|nr:F-box domain, Leucine-rich repeat domain, L domain-like protein [Artemisia annua]
MNVEVDRLSYLPDDLIYKILSSIDIRDVIQFSVLSSRWRYIWTSLRCLNFTCYYSKEAIFSQFVNNVLSGRNNIDVSSIELTGQYGMTYQVFLKNILDYAFAHNVQQMKITRFDDMQHDFPLSLLRSQSLKNFTLCAGTYNIYSSHPPTSTWDLPALTTLLFDDVTLFRCNFIIGMCQNLKNLTLNSCKVLQHGEGFSITNSQLLNLTLKNVKEWSVKFVHVDTPQLKTLSIEECTEELLISAPNLTYLLLNGTYHPIQLSAEGMRSFEKADLCINFPRGRKMQKKYARKIRDLFQHLHNVKCLALNLEIVEILCASVKVISHQPSPFASLESLKIYPAQVYPKHATKKIIMPTQVKIMPTEVKNYLLDSSPNVIFTMVSREKARAIEITKEAKRRMTELQVLLATVKADMETNRADMEREKAQVEQQLPIGEITSRHRNSYWGDSSIQPKTATDNIMFKVRDIKELLPKVLESERVEVKACYSSLCAEAETIMNKVLDDMKNQVDIKRSLFRGCFNEFASILSSCSLKMNVEVDRLSNLPDDLIYKILSSIDIRDVIQFSVLSSRWRYIWTSLRCLNFTCYYSKEAIFSQFVNNVLSGRNNIDVSSIELTGQYGMTYQVFLKNILDYASQSLKNFTLCAGTYNIYSSHPPTSTWDLPALTTLLFDDVTLFRCNFIIGMCQNLKNLTLNSCKVLQHGEGFSITNSQLLNLTLKNVKEWSVKFVHVDTPQLKTLSIEECNRGVSGAFPFPPRSQTGTRP